MRVLVTMPGHLGDILWSLPTARLLAARHNTKVDFIASPEFSAVLGLVQRQSYIQKTWIAEGWEVRDTEPREPPSYPCTGYDLIYHLGYKGWPSESLPWEIQSYVRDDVEMPDRPLALEEPWVEPIETYPRRGGGPVIAVGFTEGHIELKMGILLGLVAALPDITWRLLLPHTETHRHRAWEWWPSISPSSIEYCEANWEETATAIASADLFFGCLSAMWVVANAVGTKTVIMEPTVARHNPIFWVRSPKNHLVLGNDDKPTFDLRATRDMIEAVLKEGV